MGKPKVRLGLAEIVGPYLDTRVLRYIYRTGGEARLWFVFERCSISLGVVLRQSRRDRRLTLLLGVVVSHEDRVRLLADSGVFQLQPQCHLRWR
jgi:hypothetical protein